MPKDLDVIDKQMELGSVKTITKNGGRYTEYVEMLVADKTKAQLYYDEKNNNLQLAIKDTDFQLPSLECAMDSKSIHDLILGLKQIYSQIISKESEGNK